MERLKEFKFRFDIPGFSTSLVQQYSIEFDNAWFRPNRVRKTGMLSLTYLVACTDECTVFQEWQDKGYISNISLLDLDAAGTPIRCMTFRDCKVTEIYYPWRNAEGDGDYFNRVYFRFKRVDTKCML